MRPSGIPPHPGWPGGRLAKAGLGLASAWAVLALALAYAAKLLGLRAGPVVPHEARLAWLGLMWLDFHRILFGFGFGLGWLWLDLG